MRTLASTPWITAFKVVALGLGLAIGTLLMTRVARDMSVDTCFPDHDRIFQLWTEVERGDAGPERNASIAVREADEIADRLADQIESHATVGEWGYYSEVEINDSAGPVKSEMVFNYVAGDFFGTFGVELMAGGPAPRDGRTTLWLSEKAAMELFASTDVVGRELHIFQLNMYAAQCVVGGVFKNIPEESTLASVEVLCDAQSTEPISRGRTYVKLKDEIGADEFAAALGRLKPEITPAPLRDTFMADDGVKLMVWIMGVLAMLVVTVTVLNYILLVIASLPARSRVIGVQKCFGESGAGVAAMFAGETGLLMLGASVVAAAFCYVVMQNDELHHYLTSYMSWSRLWVPLVMIAVVFAASAAVPAVMMARLPVAHVFRHFRHKRRAWKTVLLGLELAATAFALALTLTVMTQYKYVTTSYKGFTDENLAYVCFRSLQGGTTMSEMEADQMLIKSLPYVEGVVSTAFYPGIHMSMLTVERPDGRGSFNSKKGHSAVGLFDLLDMHVVAGSLSDVKSTNVFGCFGVGDGVPVDVAVSRSFAGRMGWHEEDAIGQNFMYKYTMAGDEYEEHYKVVAVYDDICTGNYFEEQLPSWLELSADLTGGFWLVKLAAPFDENFARLRNDLPAKSPGREVDVWDYGMMLRADYGEVNTFRFLAMVSVVMIMLIAAMGLLAYLRDEVALRTKEIAIRKISGASAADIVEMLTRSVMLTAVPAIVAGTVGAWLVGRGWLTLFAMTADGIVWLQCLGALLLAVAVGAIAAALTLRTALDNPVNSLRSE